MLKFFRDVFVVFCSMVVVVIFVGLFQTNSNIGTILIFLITFSCGYFWGSKNKEKKIQKDLEKEFNDFEKNRSSR